MWKGLVLGELVFVGLGLHDEKGISLKGLEEAKTADFVFLEVYTSFMPCLSLESFERFIGKGVIVVSRKQLEDENGEIVLEAAGRGKAVLLVPGDPLIATTHVALRLEAEKRGIKTRLVHGASIISAVVGLCGLHNYKFGKSVTVPFPENFSETPYLVLAQNKGLGLHTLCLLDIDAERNRFLTVREALETFLKIEAKRRLGVVDKETLAVGVARAGSPNPTVKAGLVKMLMDYDFGGPPYSLVFPGKLHFMEAEALIAFAGAPSSVRRLME
ncbi:MAG: diphthine synthase [Candidatus Bathyarchaeota archaeon]|nr:diphthine synthase [Candidatus Bathyarchaeota archaeon]